MKLSQINNRMATTRSSIVSQEGLGDNVSAWVKNKMDAFSAWQFSNGNWFTEFNTCAENAQDIIKKNYGYGQRTKTSSKFAQLYLTKAKTNAESLSILMNAVKTANAFLDESNAAIKAFIKSPETVKPTTLEIVNLPHYNEVFLPGELKQVEVASISPKDYMTFYQSLGQINKNFLNTAKEFASSQPELRKLASDIEDANSKAMINLLIDSRMRSLKVYMHFFDSIALYCRDCLENLTTDPEEIPSKESFMKSTLKNIRSGLAKKKVSTEDHDVNISVSQDNDQGEVDTDVNAPADGTEPEIDINKLGEDAEANADKEQEIEQAVTDAQQAASIDDIATAVDTLESARILVNKMKLTGVPSQHALEALQLTIDTALAKTSRVISVPSIESVSLDRNHQLSRLEGEITLSMEGLLDDVKIWVNKQIETVDSKFNWNKLYTSISQAIDKTKETAAKYADLAPEDSREYKVPIKGDHLAYLAHAETAANIEDVWNDYCNGLSGALTGGLANLDTAIKGNLEEIIRGKKTTDEIARDFFRRLISIIHIDGSYIGYGWKNTVGNSIRKIFKRHMKWEAATFADDKMSKVTGVWAMPPKDIAKAADEFKSLVDKAIAYEKDMPARREAMRKLIVSSIEQASKSQDDKRISSAIKDVKSVYLTVIDTDKEIDKYLYITLLSMSDYLHKCAQVTTIGSNE